jgi:AraC-like DNA-binding protein
VIYKGINNEYLELRELKKGDFISFDHELSSPLTFVWIKGQNSGLVYEGISHIIPNNSILCLTVYHQIEFKELNEAKTIKFNREFYCVLDHDNEVSCKGLLFFGANQLPLFQIPDEELEKFETLWRMFQIEMESKDELQLEMLQMMLKRFIILCTRIYKNQTNFNKLGSNEIDLVRDFNFLVEQYFKSKHTVKAYADLLHKSPKTLSNIFALVSDKTPLQIIHERKLLEAKRMLRYTEKPIKEIAYELGFEDLQTFSRFFKKTENISPSEFKNSILGNFANSSGFLT